MESRGESESTYPPSNEITPDYIRSLTKPTDRVLCSLKDNELIRFGQYRIRAIDTGAVLLHISEEM